MKRNLEGGRIVCADLQKMGFGFSLFLFNEPLYLSLGLRGDWLMDQSAVVKQLEGTR